jgi:uncharacterized membrane protein (DUF106 family)
MISVTPEGATIAGISVLLSILSALVRVATVDMKKMKASKETMKQHQEKIKELQKNGDTKEMAKVQEQMMTHALDQMKQSFKPMLITFIPFILIFNWLSSQYGKSGNVADLFGLQLSWFWWYFIVSFAAAIIINKIIEKYSEKS